VRLIVSLRPPGCEKTNKSLDFMSSTRQKRDVVGDFVLCARREIYVRYELGRTNDI
jgi:hypothetical protein